MEKVTGYVGHIVFRNAENGYTVFHLENDDGEVTCVGHDYSPYRELYSR